MQHLLIVQGLGTLLHCEENCKEMQLKCRMLTVVVVAASVAPVCRQHTSFSHLDVTHIDQTNHCAVPAFTRVQPTCWHSSQG